MIKKGYKGVQGYPNLCFCEGGDLFNGLSHEEQTDILFIACADSHVLPSFGICSGTGDLHIIHMDAIVPLKNAIEDKENIAVAIDHALLTSTVTDIIVCGFSNYGTLQLADASNLLGQHKIVQEHIIDQLKRVLSCQLVERGLKEEDLSLHGWHHDMFTGKWYVFNSCTNSFEEISFV